MTTITTREAAAHRHRRDQYRARIMRQLRGLGYQVRTWPEAERVARQLTRRH